MPAVTIVTDVFEERARQYLRAHGFGHTPVIVTANPIVYLEQQELVERARSLVEPVVRGLTTPVHSPGSGR